MAVPRSPRILVVDRNAATRQRTGRHLRMAGFTVLEAESGAQAVALARQQRAHLILLDVSAAEMYSGQSYDALRALPRMSRVPVIHTATSSGRVGDRFHSLSVGYLTHPIQPEILLTIVEGFLRQRTEGSSRR